MVWGAAASGIGDLVKRVASNDPLLTSLHIMRFRRFEHQVTVHTQGCNQIFVFGLVPHAMSRRGSCLQWII